MPKKNDHKLQLERNYELLVFLEDKSYPDWTITVAFYFCVHCLEWYLAEYSWDSDTHKQREWKIKQYPELSPIFKDYRDLSTLSRKVRYDCMTSRITSANVASSINTANKIQKYLSSIRKDFPSNMDFSVFKSVAKSTSKSPQEK